MIDAQTLSVRSLNFWRRMHVPTYIGLRMFLDGSDASDLNDWLLEFTSSKGSSRLTDRHYEFKKFKGLEDGTKRFRTLYALSPTSSLVEVYILYRLSQTEVFSHKPCVYSRWLSGEKSGHIFDYYLNGYMERINSITETIQSIADPVIYVSDVKSYYPSIDQEHLMSVFGDYVKESRLPEDIQSMITGYAERVLDFCQEGIPTGPAISRVLGRVYLRAFDAQMTSEFSNRYFRYVDDIVVVCRDGEEDYVGSFIEENLREIGLRLNEDKTETLGEEEWNSTLPEISSEKDPNSFFGLKHRLKVYLSRYPNQVEELESIFLEEGFSLPLRQVFSKTKTASFKWLRSILRDQYRFTTLTDSVDSLLHLASSLKEQYKSELAQHLNKEIPASGTCRKFRLQPIRFYINRLIFLTHPSEYDDLKSFVPDVNEFKEDRVFLDAFVNNDVSQLVQYSDPLVNKYCSIKSHVDDRTPLFNPNVLPEDSAVIRRSLDSLYILSLYNVLNYDVEAEFELPEACIFNASSLDLENLGNGTINYLEEYSSLNIDISDGDLKRFLSTRYDDRERLIDESMGGSGGAGYGY